MSEELTSYMLAVRRTRPYSTEVPSFVRKRAAAGTLGKPREPTSPQHNIVQPCGTVSSVTQQAVFTDGQVDGIPVRLLLDTGSTVIIMHHHLWECRQSMGCSRKLQQLTGSPVIATNEEPLSVIDQTKSRVCSGDYRCNWHE